MCKPYTHRCTVNSIVAVPAPFDSSNGRFYSPQYVFTASDDCNIRCWRLVQPDIDVYENFKTYSSHLGPITGMLLTGSLEDYDGQLLATCSLDGTHFYIYFIIISSLFRSLNRNYQIMDTANC